MHWRAHWWGIELVSENAEDELMLKLLQLRLPKKAIVKYEDGELTCSSTPAIQPQFDYQCAGGFTLTLLR